MSWVRLDDGFAGHRKVLPRSDAAFRLEVAALCWCNQQANDGRLTAADVRLLSGYLSDPAAAPAAIAELVEAGLWEVCADGFQLHDYNEYQPSAQERQASNAAAADRMRKFRERRHKKPDDDRPEGTSAERYAVTPPVTVTPGYAVTSREVLSSRPGPIPSRPDPGKEEKDKSLAWESSPPPRPAEPLPASEPPRAGAPDGAPPRDRASETPGKQIALLSDEPKRTAPARQKRERTPAPTTATWEAYREAYRRRYGDDPVRSGKISGQLALLVGEIGAEEAPAVAAYYVHHNGAFYVQSGHSVGLLLRDAQKLRTEMRTGRRVNAEAARQNERAAASDDGYADLRARLFGKKSAEPEEVECQAGDEGDDDKKP